MLGRAAVAPSGGPRAVVAGRTRQASVPRRPGRKTAAARRPRSAGSVALSAGRQPRPRQCAGG
eukprot:scaffold103852_cov69-Phaeocystis_antarctica.AAC.4